MVDFMENLKQQLMMTGGIPNLKNIHMMIMMERGAENPFRRITVHGGIRNVQKKNAYNHN